MLKLKPSMKINRRYILLEVSKDKIEKVILEYLGILGWAKAAPVFVKRPGKRIVLAVNRKCLDDIKAALAISSEDIKVLKVSGTLKGLSKK